MVICGATNEECMRSGLQECLTSLHFIAAAEGLSFSSSKYLIPWTDWAGKASCHGVQHYFFSKTHQKTATQITPTATQFDFWVAETAMQNFDSKFIPAILLLWKKNQREKIEEQLAGAATVSDSATSESEKTSCELQNIIFFFHSSIGSCQYFLRIPRCWSTIIQDVKWARPRYAAFRAGPCSPGPSPRRCAFRHAAGEGEGRWKLPLPRGITCCGCSWWRPSRPGQSQNKMRRWAGRKRCFICEGTGGESWTLCQTELSLLFLLFFYVFSHQSLSWWYSSDPAWKVQNSVLMKTVVDTCVSGGAEKLLKAKKIYWREKNWYSREIFWLWEKKLGCRKN